MLSTKTVRPNHLMGPPSWTPTTWLSCLSFVPNLPGQRGWQNFARSHHWLLFSFEKLYNYFMLRIYTCVLGSVQIQSINQIYRIFKKLTPKYRLLFLKVECLFQLSVTCNLVWRDFFYLNLRVRASNLSSNVQNSKIKFPNKCYE